MKNIEKYIKEIAKDLLFLNYQSITLKKLNCLNKPIKEYKHDQPILTVKEIEDILMEEYKEPPILDDIEKKYLEGVIKPFKENVLIINKTDFGWREKITISYNECYTTGHFDLPPFEKGTMYKEMESNKNYTLKELGLFEGE